MNLQRSLDRRRETPETGFTLVELLIALTVSTLIMGALAGAALLVVNLTKSSSQSFVESDDASSLSAFFALDMRSAEQVTVPGVDLCAADSVLSSPSDLIDVVGPSTDESYYSGKVGSNYWLVRSICSGSSTTFAVLARNLSSTTPSITCGASQSACVSGEPTTSVNITVTAKDGYSYTLTGVPRLSLVGEPAESSNYALTTLGTGGTDITLTGSASLNATGTVVVDSSSSSPAAISATSSTKVTATGGAIDVVTGGTCIDPKHSKACTTQLSPSLTSISSPVPDPYNNNNFFLPPPQPIGCVPTAPAQACSTYAGGSENGTLQPGIYQSKVSVTNSNAVTLEPGTYFFEGGLSVTGAGVLSSPFGGVFIYIGCASSDTSCSDTSAGFSVTNSGYVNLTPLTSGPYQGISIFQARDDATTLTLTGAGSASSLNGLIYAPDANVTLGGSASITVQSILASSLTASGSSPVTLG